ncbi:hypothetical protein ENBRE01_2738 [Enteropsectra breve]|nr:hypothetical protein ENBRE01_2738 [Enteropsectra breve]
MFLNNLVVQDRYSLPHIQRIIENTQGKRLFTVLDLKDGYYQVKLREKDKKKTAFYFENKQYQMTRMVQGFKNSPAIFQAIMDEELSDQVGKCCSIYLDNIIVYGETEAQHDANLLTVLACLAQNGFKINPAKMQYKQQNVKLLGMVIDGISRRPWKISKLKQDSSRHLKR